MYPLGIMFGLGFDTSSEVALLGIASIQGAKGTSIWLILIFPMLFTGTRSSTPILKSMFEADSCSRHVPSRYYRWRADDVAIYLCSFSKRSNRCFVLFDRTYCCHRSCRGSDRHDPNAEPDLEFSATDRQILGKSLWKNRSRAEMKFTGRGGDYWGAL